VITEADHRVWAQEVIASMGKPLVAERLSRSSVTLDARQGEWFLPGIFHGHITHGFPDKADADEARRILLEELNK
jgi:hypothetical protein